MRRKFVTAFAGKRDDYQVPLALDEIGALDLFITDCYAPDPGRTLRRLFPESWQRKIENRRAWSLPVDRVKALTHLTVFDHMAKLCGVGAKRRWNFTDRQLSLAAARQAALREADLLLYEPYAQEAFTATYTHNPRRVLFHFHPHPLLEAEILSEDARAYPPPNGAWLSMDGGIDANLNNRSGEAWRSADLILCASTFTRRSLIHCGADEAKCQVVPYGIGPVFLDSGLHPRANRLDLLFVGTGVQRKGLHHLLGAWSKARMPSTASLTVVSRNMDPHMLSLLRDAGSGVTWLKGASSSQLSELFTRCHLFVMPSLVEGFGLVFLEALAHGCPVLGTSNTGLPDIGTEADGVFMVEAGEPNQLCAVLRDLPERQNKLHELRKNARQCAKKFSWEAFRRRLQEVLKI